MNKTIRINPPSHSVDDDAYLLECKFALEPSVYRLMELAVAAGWDLRTAVCAIAMVSVQLAGGATTSRLDA